jgi:hypothetical protein
MRRQASLRVLHGPQAVERLWQLLADSEIEIVPFDEVHGYEAGRDGFWRAREPSCLPNACPGISTNRYPTIDSRKVMNNPTINEMSGGL